MFMSRIIDYTEVFLYYPHDSIKMKQRKIIIGRLDLQMRRTWRRCWIIQGTLFSWRSAVSYMQKSGCAKENVIGFASEAFRTLVLQNRLLKKMIEGRYKSQIIVLQQQLLNKKDAEIASLKLLPNQ